MFNLHKIKKSTIGMKKKVNDKKVKNMKIAETGKHLLVK